MPSEKRNNLTDGATSDREPTVTVTGVISTPEGPLPEDLQQQLRQWAANLASDAVKNERRRALREVERVRVEWCDCDGTSSCSYCHMVGHIDAAIREERDA